MSFTLRSAVPMLLLVGGLWAEDIVATPAPVDFKAQIKELEAKQKPLRETVLKDDADLAKLKGESDEARKRYETAVDTKLAANADYVALKAQIDELKAQRKKQEQDAKNVKEKEQKDKPKE